MLPSVTAVPPPATPEQRKLRQACQDFEAVMLGIVFKQMAATGGGLLDGGSASRTWREMLEDERAKAMAASGGLGLADQIYRELHKRV